MKKVINNKIRLTNAEYNLLNKITHQTKTDCWFWLDTDKSGFDCVKDLERGHKVTLRFAVAQLNEALEGCTDLLNLTAEEIETYGQLMQKLELPNPFEEYIQVMTEVYDGNANGICTTD